MISFLLGIPCATIAFREVQIVARKGLPNGFGKYYIIVIHPLSLMKETAKESN